MKAFVFIWQHISLYLNVGFSILYLMHYLIFFFFLLVRSVKLLVSLFHFSFEQLKMAVTNLKRQANKKSEGSLACVKGGLSTFFEAQDALAGKVTLRAICCGFHNRNLTLCLQSVYRVWHSVCVYKSWDIKCAINIFCRLGWNLFEGLIL